MKQHVELHECGVADCLFMSKSHSEVQFHKITAHSIWQFNCQLCGKGVEKSKNLPIHMKSHETGEPGVIKCNMGKCKRTFTAAVDLKKHMESHSKSSLEPLDYSFLDPQTLDDPQRKVNECPLCGKIIKERGQLQVHVVKHQTETPGVLKCIQKGCHQTFISASQLKDHAQYHSNSFLTSLDYSRLDLQALEYPQRNANECLMCGKIIKVKSQFRMHLVKHETQIPGVIKCIYTGCNETFTSASDLREHSRHHWDLSKSVLRSNECDVPGCNFATTTETLLVLHKRGMHSPALWKCYACGKIYKNKSYVMRHINSVHKKQPSVKNANPFGQSQKIVKEQLGLVCKDETEEVVFD